MSAFVTYLVSRRNAETDSHSQAGADSVSTVLVVAPLALGHLDPCPGAAHPVKHTVK
jgi:hypothetical protein